jgi:thiol-disulfide isomerase/thioredoxin
MNRPPTLLVFCLLALMNSAGLMAAANADLSAPSFDLPLRDGSQRVQLVNLKRHIVILDFFAHWCVPCVRASSELESGIQAYYDQRHGNPHGIPVELFAINVEAGQPEKTRTFIQRTGLKQVCDDLPGDVFKQYGGSGMPFLVIIDATGGRTGEVPPLVVYRRAGFEGVARLREVIDAIGETPNAQTAAETPAPPVPVTIPTVRTPLVPPPETSTNGAPANAGQTQESPKNVSRSITTPPGIPATNVSPALLPAAGDLGQSASLDFATMFAPDILLADEVVEYRQTRPVSDVSVTFSQNHIALHYMPDSAVEQARDVDNDQFSLQTEGRFRLSDTFTGSLGGGGYSGYLDYRSLWLNEHFRQLFSMRSGYEPADPWGWNSTAGLRWEYLPAAGFAQADVTYQHDIISPGYDVSLASFPPKLERFRADYDTVSAKLSLENVLTRRVRTLQELQMTGTTDRQLRCGLQSSLNYAVTEHWVARPVISFTEETPRFDAGSGGVTLERDWQETWFLSAMVRYYRDNGEVVDALLAEDTAAPPLETVQSGVGLRWQGPRTSVKLFAGPYFGHYQQSGPAFDTFPHLYQNRDWLVVQFAIAHEF